MEFRDEISPTTLTHSLLKQTVFLNGKYEWRAVVRKHSQCSRNDWIRRSRFFLLWFVQQSPHVGLWINMKPVLWCSSSATNVQPILLFLLQTGLLLDIFPLRQGKRLNARACWIYSQETFPFSVYLRLFFCRGMKISYKLESENMKTKWYARSINGAVTALPNGSRGDSNRRGHAAWIKTLGFIRCVSRCVMSLKILDYCSEWNQI